METVLGGPSPPSYHVVYDTDCCRPTMCRLGYGFRKRKIIPYTLYFQTEELNHNNPFPPGFRFDLAAARADIHARIVGWHCCLQVRVACIVE